jgi:polyisoprenoid-binding protein YceI
MALAPPLASADPIRFTLDPAETELVALTRPAGLLRGASHPHAIAARGVEGEVRWDAERPERSSVELRFPAGELENDDPALRRKYGLSGTLDETDRRKVAEALRGPDQLDVARHPLIAFASRSVVGQGADRLEVRGLLTIRGVGAEVALPVRLAVQDGVLRGQGTLPITHAMFGFQPISAALGTIRNAEEIVLRLTLVGRAIPGAGPPGASP